MDNSNILIQQERMILCSMKSVITKHFTFKLVFMIKIKHSGFLRGAFYRIVFTLVLSESKETNSFL